MANLTATYAADFTPFLTAVAKAEASLKSFETGAGNVEKSLNRMTDSLSGIKIVQQAEIAAKAVQEIGGVSKLTDKELQRLGATAQEAAEKLQRLGQSVPPGIQHIADAAKQAADRVKESAASIENMAGKSSFAETKMLALGTAIGSFAGGVATQALSKLGQELGAFIERGAKMPAIEASFRRLAEGVKQNAGEMVAAMAEGSTHLVADFDLMQSANKAMLLGLPVTAQGMGDLAKTATILGKAMGQDATKSLDDLITALGRSSPMILDNLGLTVKVGEANEAYARKLGLTAEQLDASQTKMAFYEAAMEAARKKTGELGEQSKTLGEILQTVWTRVGNVVTQQASEMNIGIGKAMSSWKEFGDFLQVAGAQGINAAIKFEADRANMATAAAAADRARTQAALDDLNKLEAARKGAGASMVEQLKIAREHVAALTSEQVANVAAMLALGKEYKDLPKDIKLTAGEFELLRTGLQKSAEASKAAAVEAKKHAEIAAEVAAGTKGVTDSVYLQIVALTKQGQSQATIAKALGLHVVQVQQVITAEKNAADNNKLWTDQQLRGAEAVRKIMDDAIKRANESPTTKATLANVAIEGKARREAADLQAKLALSAYEYEKYLIRQWGDDQKAAVNQGVGNWENAYTAIEAAVRAKLVAIVSHQQGAVRVTSDWSEQLSILSSEFQKLGSASGGTLGAFLGGVGQMIVLLDTADKATKQIGTNNKELGGSFGALSVMFNDSATDAQRWAATIQTATALASGAMDVWTMSANQGSAALNALGGAAAGAKAGAAFGVYGMMIGAATGATIGWIRSMNDGRQTVEEFANRNGGFDELHKRMLMLGADGEKMWVSITQGINRGNSDQAVREIKKIEGALNDLARKAEREFNEAAFFAEKAFRDAADAAKKAADEELEVQADLREAIKEYGFTIEELGPKWRQQELDIGAQKLLKSYSLLVASGIDVALVQTKMSDSINEYLHNALKTGATIPESWKPILESMAAAGKLTDENGDKLTDLSRVSWSQTLGDKFDTLASKLEKILNHILGIGDALEYIGKKGDPFKIPELEFTGGKVPNNGQLGGLLPPADGPSASVHYAGPQAKGGDYLVTRPTLFLAGEAGPERATFTGAGRTGRTNGGVTVNINNPVVRERQDLDRMSDLLARRLQERGL